MAMDEQAGYFKHRLIIRVKAGPNTVGVLVLLVVVDTAVILIILKILKII
jgi:hypothetical protein